ncbi:MAG: CYTH domain-containing protein [Calditrichia bacterium]
MATEIERKFLLKNDSWRHGAKGMQVRQGYLCTDIERTARVRTVGNNGFLTIKGKSKGAARREFEYAIPLTDANTMLEELCKKPLIEKKRYKIEYGGFIWEVDEFYGENEGLILVEVELEHENQELSFPDWVGREVTGDPKYFNANLIEHPYKTWGRTYSKQKEKN